MSIAKLPDSLQMSAVTLWVKDLDSMVKFYRDAVGLDVIAANKDSMTLGHHKLPIVILDYRPEMKHAGPKDAGLFHTAILFDSQQALAHAVYSVAKKYPGSFTGSADHLVSKAFYFNDPEGNGVELYWDREKTEWSWIHGSVEMDTLFLDPNQFLTENLTDEPIAHDKRVGHIHLSVGSIAAAEEFYVRMLGFNKTLNWNNQAIFISAAGYHHHMAMNIWRSKGAGKRQLTLGLADVKIKLDSEAEVEEVSNRLAHYGQKATQEDSALVVYDPWDNQITLVS
jgi:catechol 2,3-dioxygenase